ncbi:YcxB family protein [Salinimonas iocasae]|uniref:YcxB family protein n=1 Tax=Salinimonas iocasae TaxID=2572577 RepID=A0A5B7YC87_9ALTE|nr:YcxB family protein [Salinimonas iocasae]
MQGSYVEIKYTNTKEDLLAFNEHHLANSQVYQRRRIINLYVTPFVVLLVFCLLAFFTGKTSYYAGGVLGALASYLWTFVAYKRYAKKCSEVFQKEVFCEHKVVISDVGVNESTANSSSQFTWDALDKIETNEDYIFIYNTPATAFVIPKREIGKDSFEAVKLALDNAL